MEDYYNSLNNGTKFKGDYKLAHSYDIQEWDPKGLTTTITGGIVLLIASTGSGKTVLLNHLIADNYKDFDDIVLICPTAKLQKCYDYFPAENVMKTFEEQYLEKLWESHERIYEENGRDSNKRHKTLVVLDDVIDLPEFKKSKMMDEIAHGGRHLGIYICLLSQDWNSIKPTQRKNARIVISFSLPSKKEREKITQACMSMENDHIGELLYRRITDVKYQCVVCKNYIVGGTTEEKINKFTADPNKKPKIKKKRNLAVLEQEPLKLETRTFVDNNYDPYLFY